jgi:hypothetical protein
MQEKQKSNVWNLLLGMMTALSLVIMVAACPTSSGDDTDDGDVDSATFPPEKPRITASQTGFELVNVDLKTVTDAEANNLANQGAVVSFVWEGEGAKTYNVYWSDESLRPDTPNVTGLTEPVYFARNLDPDTEYYFWVEGVNRIGSTLSDPVTKTTGKKGPQVSGGVERGHFPQNIQVIPGSGSLTVSWGLSDRVGWYEVYYAPVGTIKHLDIYTPVEFRYDSNETLRPGAIDLSTSSNVTNISYKGNGATGHTRPLYPYLTPLAPNSGYEGYYVRDGSENYVDGDTRPVIGAGTLPAGTFYKIMEAYDQGIQDPYKKLDSAFAQATPWDGTANGTPGTPVKFFGTSTTITGLQNDTIYEVWIRSPNANGERAYSYVLGTPGAGAVLLPPSSVQVSTPPDTTRDLAVSWSPVAGAEKYRIYTSKFDYTPNVTMSYSLVEGSETSYTVIALEGNTTYYVWVVAEKNGIAGSFGSLVSGKTGAPPATGKSGDKTIAGTTHKVKTAVYIEVNDDNPLNAGSYILDDGTYLFDYVILFAANIRNRNCAVDGGDGCTESGPHVHFNPNVRYILNNRNKYIKPLQDKGMKVLLGLLGDHDGIGFGTLNDTQRVTFIADLKKDVEDNGLDGVDFDDEWGSKEDWEGWGNGLAVGASGKTYDTISPNSIWTYPTSTWGWPTNVTVYRDTSKGTGIEGVVAGNGTRTAPSQAEMNEMWRKSGESFYKTIKAARDALGPDKIVALYEYNTGRHITESGQPNGTATKDLLQGAVDFALQPWYNQYLADSANELPRSMYSPFGMDLSGEAYSAQNGAPNPPIVVNDNAQASDTIYDYATRFKTAAASNPYNMLYFYGLEEATALLKRSSSDSSPRVTKEAYISMMTEIVFGKKTLLTAEGGDYRKDW